MKIPYLNFPTIYEELQAEFDEAYRRVMSSGYYILGPEVEAFEDGNKALKRFNEKHFDIVVLDVRMEDIDGLQILEKIKAQSEKNTQVIIITGYATIEIAKEALVKGAFDFIAKPFRPNELRLAIEKAAKSLGFKNLGASRQANAIRQ